MSVRLTPRSSKVGHYERKEGSEKRSVYWRSPFGAQSVATALDDKCWKRFVAVLWEAEILWAGITAVTIPRAGCKRWTVRERARDLWALLDHRAKFLRCRPAKKLIVLLVSDTVTGLARWGIR